MNKTVKIILGIVIVAAVAAGSFFGGTLYGKSQAQAQVQAQFAARGPGGFPNRQFGAAEQPGQGRTGQGGMLIGEITQVNPDGLVIKATDGKETQVKVADTTLIEKNMSVEITDLTEGEMVIISGSTAADGTVTARSLQVAPAGRFSALGGPAPAGPSGQGQSQGDALPPPPAFGD